MSVGFRTFCADPRCTRRSRDTHSRNLPGQKHKNQKHQADPEYHGQAQQNKRRPICSLLVVSMESDLIAFADLLVRPEKKTKMPNKPSRVRM